MPRSRVTPRRAAVPRPRVDRRLNPASHDDRTLVQRAIDHSGLSTDRFAVEVLRVSPRTIYRYLRGETALRRLDREDLIRYVGTPLTPEAP